MILKRGMPVGLADVAGVTRFGEQSRIRQLINTRCRLRQRQVCGVAKGQAPTVQYQ